MNPSLHGAFSMSEQEGSVDGKDTVSVDGVDRNADGDGDAGRVRRRWLAVFGIVLLILALVVAILMWIKRPVDATVDFDKAKITTAYVDGEPFMRQKLPEGTFYRPIEVMQGTVVPVECFSVKLPGTSTGYTISAFGKTVELADCVGEIEVTGQVGDYANVRIEYRDAKAGLIDTLEIPIAVVARSERVELYQIQDSNHQNVMAGGVPDRIYLYGRAITNLPGDSSEYGALFFVADPANEVPIVQMMPLHQGETPKPMIGELKRYRSYGRDLAGYAMWTPETIQVNPVNRTVTDIYIGIFRMSEIQDVFNKLLKVEVTAADTVTVTPLVSSPYDVMAMTAGGKLLSQAFHVVSGPGRVEIGSATPAAKPDASPTAVVVPQVVSPVPPVPAAPVQD